MVSKHWKMTLLSNATGGADGEQEPSPAAQGVNGAADPEETKAKPSRALKTPLQKEALEAAYSSEPHNLI